jgi:hypothetical protein
VGGNPATASERALALSAAIDGVPGANQSLLIIKHWLTYFSQKPRALCRGSASAPATNYKACPPLIVDPSLTLGEMVTTDESRMAFVISRTDPRGLWLKEGEDFQGWKLKSVKTTGATLNQQDRSIELQLYGKP